MLFDKLVCRSKAITFSCLVKNFVHKFITTIEDNQKAHAPIRTPCRMDGMQTKNNFYLYSCHIARLAMY